MRLSASILSLDPVCSTEDEEIEMISTVSTWIYPPRFVPATCTSSDGEGSGIGLE
jgi:hypothetical protein